MSNENEMNVKYQQHYNKILTGTLTDTIMKSISYQANIQLANEIIAEQEKSLTEAQTASEDLKKELDSVKSGKTTLENSRIVGLENQIKTHQATISKLQTDLYEANKLRSEYENVKHQVQHLDSFRNDLIKTREELKNTQISHQKKVDDLKSDYEKKLTELQLVIDNLKTPTKTKKATTKTVAKKSAPIKTIEVEEIQDGGSF